MCNLLPSVCHTDAEERGMRLGGKAMHSFSAKRIHASQKLWKHDVILQIELGKGQCIRDGADACGQTANSTR